MSFCNLKGSVNMKTGVQLYSVRTNLAEDFEGTLKAVAEMGYDGVEFAGLNDNDPKVIAELCAKYNLEPISAHVNYDELRDKTEETMKAYSTIGCKFVVIPYLVEEHRPGSEGFDELIKNAARIGKAAREYGMTLLYHNHDFEFQKIGDEYALDVLYSSVPAEFLQTEVDTCWVNVAGEDPAAYVRKYTGRAPIVHLKDFFKKGHAEKMFKLIGIDDNDTNEDTGENFGFRPVGKGMQNVPELLSAAADAGAGWVIVEQDEPSLGLTRMECIKSSIDYLKTLDY